MKQVSFFLLFISFVLVLIACSEDTMVESLDKVNRLENSKIWLEPESEFTLQLDLTKPELS